MLKNLIQKTAEATDLIGNKIVNEIRSASKKSSAEHSVELHSKHDDANSEIEVPKKDTYPQERKATNYWWIKINTKKGCIFLEIIDELRLALKERYTSPEERQQIIDELRLL